MRWFSRTLLASHDTFDSLFPANDRPQLLSMTGSLAILFLFSLFLSVEHTKCLGHFWESNKVYYWEETGSNTHRQKSAVFTWMLEAVSHDGKWNVWNSTGWIKRVLVKWWAFYHLCPWMWQGVNLSARQAAVVCPQSGFCERGLTFNSPLLVAFCVKEPMVTSLRVLRSYCWSH